MKETSYPFEIAKKIATDTERNMTSNIGRLKILEQFDELPLEYRGQLLHMLSAFHRPQIRCFYQMIQDEYGNEYQTEIERALKKLQMAGVEETKPEWFQGSFHAGYCTRTRHTGMVSVSIFWHIAPDNYTAECFLLNFGVEGISNFVLIENICEADMQQEERMLQSLTHLTLRECQLLLTTSYASNQKMLVRPSLGHFLYKRHILSAKAFELSEARAVNIKVSAFLYGKRFINSLFLALKNDDMDYVISLFEWEKFSPERSLEVFAPLKKPGTLFLEGCAENVIKQGEQVHIRGYLLLYSDQKLQKYPYDFHMTFASREVRWMIEKIVAYPPLKMSFSQLSNSLRRTLFVRVYQILDMENLLNGLDMLEQVQKVGELPYGLHLRICTADDTFFEQGVTLMSGVVADLVINGEEFVVLSDQEIITREFDGKFSDCTVFKKAYQVSMNTAIHYYQGQYRSFEDVLEVPEDHFPQDPMQFVTACYVVYDRKAFYDFIQQRKVFRFEVPEEQRILYYQFEKVEELGSFEAEYIVDGNYLTVSTFGKTQLKVVQQDLEKSLRGHLHFEHLEVNPQGFFEILTPEVKEAFPQLETIMKEIYLNKWYVSSSPFLENMTPKEAKRTEEGRRMLWKMFKTMCAKPSWFAAGGNANIAIQEFFTRLEKEKS